MKNLNDPCAICGARLVLHTMYLDPAKRTIDLQKPTKCPGGSWITWYDALGIDVLALVDLES
jgi:hypothetical protein